MLKTSHTFSSSSSLAAQAIRASAAHRESSLSSACAGDSSPQRSKVYKSKHYFLSLFMKLSLEIHTMVPVLQKLKKFVCADDQLYFLGSYILFHFEFHCSSECLVLFGFNFHFIHYDQSYFENYVFFKCFMHTLDALDKLKGFICLPSTPEHICLLSSRKYTMLLPFSDLVKFSMNFPWAKVKMYWFHSFI